MRKRCIAIMAIVMVLSWGISNIAADKALRIFIPLLKYEALSPVKVDLMGKTSVRLRFAVKGWMHGDFNADGVVDSAEISQAFNILVQRLNSNLLIVKGQTIGRLQLNAGDHSTGSDLKFAGSIRGSGSANEDTVALNMILKCRGKHIKLNLVLNGEFQPPNFEFVSLEGVEGLSWIEIHNPSDSALDIEG